MAAADPLLLHELRRAAGAAHRPDLAGGQEADAAAIGPPERPVRIIRSVGDLRGRIRVEASHEDLTAPIHGHVVRDAATIGRPHRVVGRFGLGRKRRETVARQDRRSAGSSTRPPPGRLRPRRERS